MSQIAMILTQNDFLNILIQKEKNDSCDTAHNLFDKTAVSTGYDKTGELECLSK